MPGMDWELAEVGTGTGGQAAVQDFLGFAQLDSALAGRVRLVGEPVADGTMGAVAIGARIVGVVARAVASVVVVWLNAYHSDVTIRVTSADGRSVEVIGSRVRRMRVDELDSAVARVAAVLDGGGTGDAGYVRVALEGNPVGGLARPGAAAE